MPSPSLERGSSPGPAPRQQPGLGTGRRAEVPRSGAARCQPRSTSCGSCARGACSNWMALLPPESPACGSIRGQPVPGLCPRRPRLPPRSEQRLSPPRPLKVKVVETAPRPHQKGYHGPFQVSGDHRHERHHCVSLTSGAPNTIPPPQVVPKAVACPKPERCPVNLGASREAEA